MLGPENGWVLGAALLLGLTACDPPQPGDGGGYEPAEGPWRSVLDVPLVAERGDPNAPDVLEFQIGSLGQDENFMNRGDVEVFYTLPPLSEDGLGRIVVAMQPFSGSPESSALDPVKPWLARGRLRPLADVPNEDLCTQEFGYGCNIGIYYEGLTQPARVGANLRVYLPRDYRGHVKVLTEDNLWPAAAYLERSNVRIVGLYGEATVQLASGRAEVVLAEDLLPAPGCGDTGAASMEANHRCETYVDPVTDEALPWDRHCGCVDRLGHLELHAIEAADIVVDVPPSVWTVVHAANRGKEQDAEDHCSAEIACDDFESCERDASLCTPDEPWKCVAIINDPGQAVPGIGYRVKVVSAECDDVSFHDGPGSYGAAPEIDRRGDVAVCSGCLDTSTPPPPS